MSIPLYKVGCVRVTHPSAGRLTPRIATKPAAPRLACVMPTASVHPEPGSNSPLYILLYLSPSSLNNVFLDKDFFSYTVSPHLLYPSVVLRWYPTLRYLIFFLLRFCIFILSILFRTISMNSIPLKVISSTPPTTPLLLALSLSTYLLHLSASRPLNFGNAKLLLSVILTKYFITFF